MQAKSSNLLPNELKTQVTKVLIAAGGTGGHLFPAQQLAKILETEMDVLFIGHRLKESPFFQQNHFPFVDIAAHPLKRGFFKALWKGFWPSVQAIRKLNPDVVVGFGSYHVFPALLASVILRKKLILFEPNCLLGKVNRFFAPFSDCLALQWPIPNVKGTLVPCLPWKKEEKNCLSQKEARAFYGLDPELETLLVFGGSQGASFFNETVPQAVQKWDRKFQVLHLTGSDPSATQSEYRQHGILAHVKAFEQEMQIAYAAATIALCRSGAGTIAELMRFQVPALLIPYPYATDGHQEKNGAILTSSGGAAMLLQKEASSNRLIEALDQVWSQKEAMRKALCKTWRQQGDRIPLIEIIQKLGKKGCKRFTIS